MNTHDRIDLAHLRQALTGTRFSGHLQYFDAVESTSSLLLAAAAAGAPDGTVYLADAQTAGRGRGNHRWESEPGDGLYVSVLVRLALPLADALLLSLATGLAVQQAVLEATALALDLRWPNDLMLRDADADAEAGEPGDGELGDGERSDGEQKKCGGILVETAVEPGPDPLLRYAVIGIGLNVHQTAFPPELADFATSLELADRRRRDDPEDIVPLFRASILIALLRGLDRELQELEERSANGRSRLLQRFTAASSWVYDKRVSVSEEGGYTGTTAGLNESGFLLVEGDDGRMHTVLSGGVRAL
jgi:BirA family biotin operon repressor/biotin-[acetyl-CoA-carboxylase] ligase